MERAVVYFWTHNYKLTNELEYEHNQEIPIDDVFKVAQEIFDAGLNVMVYRDKDNDRIVLFIDNMRFQQR